MAKAKATAAAKAARKPRALKGETAPASRGLAGGDVLGDPPEAIRALSAAVSAAGGTTIASYREPFGGRWVLLAALPVSAVEPTPFQRDVSPTHVERLGRVIDKIGRFLDPIIAVARDGGRFWTPNGNHRLTALRRLGARTITALCVPEREVAYQILALNTEKAHNLRERALEVARMYRDLCAGGAKQPESRYALEFDEPALCTLGVCYETRPRFSGGAYQSFLRRADGFLEESLPRAWSIREGRAHALLTVDDVVIQIVSSLKAREMESPALKAFVVSRINPIRFSKATVFDFDDSMAKMLATAKRFDPEKVTVGQLAEMGGPPSGDATDT